VNENEIGKTLHHNLGLKHKVK